MPCLHHNDGYNSCTYCDAPLIAGTNEGVFSMHNPYRNEEKHAPVQQHQFDLIGTHTYFSQYRKDHPGSEQICQAIEQKMLQILDTIFIINKPKDTQ